MEAAGQGVLGIGIKIISFLAILRRVNTGCLALAKQAVPPRQPVRGAIPSIRATAASMAHATTDGVIMCIKNTAVVHPLKSVEALGEPAAATGVKLPAVRLLRANKVASNTLPEVPRSAICRMLNLLEWKF